MKAKFFFRFEPLAFKGPSPTWYARLHAQLKLRVAADCLVRGGKMTKKAVGFGREVLMEICEYLMNQDDEALGCEERCIIALLYAAVGRGGEVSYTTWNSARWDKAREHLAFDWGEKKKGAQYLMTFHPDSTDWRVDVIHALACYVLCGKGGGKASTSPQESGVHWLFGNYVGMAEGGAASKVSRILELEKCRNGGVGGIPDDSNSHGVRVGATDEMIFNHMLSVFAAIARGGWDFKADCMLFYYFTQELHVSQGGKALANWSNPNMHVSAPTLKAITDENEDVERFCKALFASADIPGINLELVDVRNVMVATLLRYYDDVYNELKKGRNSLVILTLHNAAIACGIDFGTIRRWGKEVKEDFITKNAQNFGNSAGSDNERISKALTILQESCSNLNERLKHQEILTKTLLTKVDLQDQRLEKMTNLLETCLTNQAHMSSGIDMILHQSCPSGTPSPTRPIKKRKTATPEVAATAVETTPADANVASTASTKTVDEELTAPKRTIKWEELLRGMGCGEFVQEVVWCNVNFHANHFLPALPTDDQRRKDKLRKLRLIATSVFEGMEKVAKDEEKDIFLRWKVPRGCDASSVDARTEWLRHVKQTASDVAIRFAKSLIKRHLVAEGKYTEHNFCEAFHKQKMNVGPIYSRLEKLKNKN